MSEPEAPPDGTPLFYLYARNPKTRVMWYPVSMLRGDGQSKGLISAWLGSPFGVLQHVTRRSAADSCNQCYNHGLHLCVQVQSRLAKWPMYQSSNWDCNKISEGDASALSV